MVLGVIFTLEGIWSLRQTFAKNAPRCAVCSTVCVLHTSCKTKCCCFVTDHSLDQMLFWNLLKIKYHDLCSLWQQFTQEINNSPKNVPPAPSSHFLGKSCGAPACPRSYHSLGLPEEAAPPLLVLPSPLLTTTQILPSSHFSLPSCVLL